MIERGPNNLDWAVQILREAVQECGTLPTDGFYGTISFTLQNGLIVNSKTEKTQKPPAMGNR